jgi:hypothetical protein
MSLYVITRPPQPHIVLFAASTLTEVGAALRAQPDADELAVLFNQEGFSRSLTPDEQAQLRAVRVGDFHSHRPASTRTLKVPHERLIEQPPERI